MTGNRQAIEEILALPNRWHLSGNLPGEVLRRLDALLLDTHGGVIRASAETGCGKSTLLLSQYAERHLCFTMEDAGENASLPTTRASPLLRSAHVTFILGPSQRTVQHYDWDHEIDVALIDGGHAYPFPDLDYYGFYPHLRPGGLLVVDDIHIPTIKRLHDFLVVDAMFSDLGRVHNTAFLRRTDAPTFPPLGDGWLDQIYNRIHYPNREALVPRLGENWWTAYPAASPAPERPAPPPRPRSRAYRLLAKGYRAAKRAVRPKSRMS